MKEHFYFPPDETNVLVCEDITCLGKALAIDGTELGEVKLIKAVVVVLTLMQR